MANELIVTDLLGNNGDIINFTCSGTTAIVKGAIMELLTDRTVQTVSAADVPVVGIAAYAKSATDGRTSIGVITNCIAKVLAETGNPTIGDTVSPSATANRVNLASTLDDEKGWALGYALEDFSAGETGLIRIKK